MTNVAELLRTSEWSQYPRIEALLDPKKSPHPKRLIRGGLKQQELFGSTGGAGGLFPRELIEELRGGGLVLDIGCGLNAQLPEGWQGTPVGFIPNAYGIDPVFKHVPGNGFEGRTLPAYAEDLPFKSKVFDITFSVRGLGWYAGASFDPYWSLHEMVRVTKPGGVVVVSLGSGGGVGIEMVSLEQNYERIMNALNRLQSDKLGRRRIAQVYDYYTSPSSQISLALK